MMGFTNDSVLGHISAITTPAEAKAYLEFYVIHIIAQYGISRHAALVRADRNFNWALGENEPDLTVGANLLLVEIAREYLAPVEPITGNEPQLSKGHKNER